MESKAESYFILCVPMACVSGIFHTLVESAILLPLQNRQVSVYIATMQVQLDMC